ncbi:MAG: outer membrane beta-barrel protein [Bacteroidia bacterium]
MNENRHPIDDLFRDGLSQHSVEPPMHVWERIDQTRTPVYKLLNNFKQNSRWYLSVAAGLVLMSSAAVMFLTDAPEMDLADGSGTTVAPAQIERGTTSESVNPNPNGTAVYQGTNPNIDNGASLNPANPSAMENNPSANEYSEEAGSEDGVYSTPPVLPTPHSGGRMDLPLIREFGTEKRDGNKVVVPYYDVPPVDENREQAPKEIHAVVPPQITPADAETPNANAEVPQAKTEADPLPTPAPDKTTTPEAPPIEPSRWALEVLGSYDFMSRRIQNADPAYVNARKDAEKMGAAYTFQLRAQYRLSDLFALRSGVSFSQHHEKLNFTHTQSNTQIVERQETGYILNPINGPTPITYTVRDTVTTTTTTSAKSDNTYTFIDIPVLLNYTFYTSNKWNLGVSGGPVFNLAFKQKGQILGPVNNEIIDLNSAANPFRTYAGVNLMLNLSTSYQLSKQFDILFEPGLRYGMSSLTSKGFGVTQKYSSVNLFTGIRYRF